MRQSVAGGRITVVFPVYAPQLLHLFDNLDGILLYESLVGQDVLLFGATVEFCACQNVGDGAKPVN